jgi:HSP20 family protein
MAIIRLEPTRELRGLQRDFDRLFGTVFDSQTVPGSQRATAGRWVPAFDLIETDENFLLRADLPGLAPEDVSIELDDSTLTVSGERKSEHVESQNGYRRIERATGSFSRALRLPDGVPSDSVQASFEHGVLEVTIPKPQRRKPVRVAINQAGAASRGEQQQD